ncbi:SGNH/GDSL hydrolase family protein [Cryptosporangium aurantiacum]|uniref:Lysophospholipase L1 n=1 Tax=Cryptosporangium aurantiacum TaxID=134849 RepID=A0A1M7RNC5_9ACTN|nr:SGNH/GDSL hydrolase family protein [Cryptosporangium aurantiacum]SHN47837.1 Lysophospholipase L1 [Cryptosporangium aurantiacum]
MDGRVLHAKRVAIGAACGGGGLGLLSAAFYGLLLGQANLARRAIQPLEMGPPAADGRYVPPSGTDAAPPVRLALLGDSSMVGYGVETVDQTPGALFGTGLARLADRPVDVVSAAVIGARSVDLAAQVDVVLGQPHRPDLALIFIGGNDVTHKTRPSIAVEQLKRAVARLVDAGVEVVVGTCPDLGTIRPIPQPLRYIVRRWSRDLAAAQTVASVEAGGRTVSLGDLLGAEFAANPVEMFSPDRFHPSAAGYGRAVDAMLPSAAAALGIGPAATEQPRPERGEGVRSLVDAAVAAAEAAGTEVAPAEVAGRERGPWGRWVELRHRIRLFGGTPNVGKAPETVSAA